MDPNGRIVVVTGAAGGIGGALVAALLRGDARAVIATDLDAGPLERLHADLGREGLDPDRVHERVRTCELDVTDETATRALVREIADTVGPIDMWFANAGVATASGLDAHDTQWQRQWQVNVMAHLYAARALIPGWTERGEGHLVTTASMAGILTAAGDGAYSTSKHAAVGLAEWLAYTYAHAGVRVSCVCPGAVDTSMLRAGAHGDATRASAAIGAGEVLRPHEAANRILRGVVEDRFLVLTHPDMRDYAIGKAQDPERWIAGMTRLWARAQTLLD